MVAGQLTSEKIVQQGWRATLGKAVAGELK